MKYFLTSAVIAAIFFTRPASAQILMNGGTYAQNFDSLTNGGNPNWTNNLTLPGWYASKAGADNTNTLAGAGTSTSGGIYSFATNGINAASDRALGSIATGTTVPFYYGVRFTNNTADTVTNILISYAGEQWRVGSSAIVQKLAFSYLISSTPITNSFSGSAWATFPALDFSSPNAAGASQALDGNAAINRVVFTSILLAGAALTPGQEIFLRWQDNDDTGTDSGLAIDDLTVSFASTAFVATPPAFTTQPASQSVSAGDTVSFSVAVSGTAPFSYQWRSNSIAISGATNDTFTLSGVTTNLTGSSYFVTVTNAFGVTNSQSATLTVNPPPPTVTTTNGLITLLTYNVGGNGVADWSTNTAQAQAIGRQLVYFNADIITFNEIPYTNTWQMANWVAAFMPGFYLATNSGTDSFIRSVVASRFPIARSQSWLGNSSLAPYGYTGTGFTRDLFEAQITVPNWPLPLHVFVAHLKATTSAPQDDANKRAAQASAVSNFLANTFLSGTNGSHPYVLTGDLNEDAFNPDNTYISGHPIQRLTSAPTGLQLTTPVNPFWNSPSNSYTESIRGPLDTRFDYILPSPAMFSNIVSSQVFRTDLLTNFPSNLFSNDNKIASDHLPVLMTFANPFNTPFRLLSMVRGGQSVTLEWESQKNRSFNIEASSNLTAWTPFATNLTTATTNSPYVFTSNNVADPVKFFRIYRAP